MSRENPTQGQGTVGPRGGPSLRNRHQIPCFFSEKVGQAHYVDPEGYSKHLSHRCQAFKRLKNDYVRCPYNLTHWCEPWQLSQHKAECEDRPLPASQEEQNGWDALARQRGIVMNLLDVASSVASGETSSDTGVRRESAPFQFLGGRTPPQAPLTSTEGGSLTGSPSEGGRSGGVLPSASRGRPPVGGAEGAARLRVPAHRGSRQFLQRSREREGGRGSSLWGGASEDSGKCESGSDDFDATTVYTRGGREAVGRRRLKQTEKESRVTQQGQGRTADFYDSPRRNERGERRRSREREESYGRNFSIPNPYDDEEDEDDEDDDRFSLQSVDCSAWMVRDTEDLESCGAMDFGDGPYSVPYRGGERGYENFQKEMKERERSPRSYHQTHTQIQDRYRSSFYGRPSRASPSRLSRNVRVEERQQRDTGVYVGPYDISDDDCAPSEASYERGFVDRSRVGDRSSRLPSKSPTQPDRREDQKENHSRERSGWGGESRGTEGSANTEQPPFALPSRRETKIWQRGKLSEEDRYCGSARSSGDVWEEEEEEEEDPNEERTSEGGSVDLDSQAGSSRFYEPSYYGAASSEGPEALSEIDEDITLGSKKKLWGFLKSSRN